MGLTTKTQATIRPIVLLRWLLLACMLQSQVVVAESPMVFRSLGFDEGLSQSTVMDTHQDSRGFIWIATESGLNRYDGYDMVVFSRDPGNPKGLASDYIWAIDEDNAGNIWHGDGWWRRRGLAPRERRVLLV